MTNFEVAFSTGLFIIAVVNLVVVLVEKMTKK